MANAAKRLLEQVCTPESGIVVTGIGVMGSTNQQENAMNVDERKPASEELQEDRKWKREEQLWALYEMVRALIKDGFEPAEVLRFALQGMGPGTMQNGVPMVLGKTLAAGLAACADFDFRDKEQIALEREWEEEEAERQASKTEH